MLVNGGVVSSARGRMLRAPPPASVVIQTFARTGGGSEKVGDALSLTTCCYTSFGGRGD